MDWDTASDSNQLIIFNFLFLVFKTCFVFVFLFVRNIFQVNRGRDGKKCTEGARWSEPAGERCCTFSLTSFKWTGDGCNKLRCSCARGKRFCTTTWLYCEPGSAWSSTSPPSWSCPTSFCWRGPEIITFMKLNEKYTYMDGSRRLGPRRSGPRLAIGAPPPWP